MDLKKFTSKIPYWAFLLVLLSIITNTIYFIYKQQQAVDGLSSHLEYGRMIVDHITPGGPAEKAGIVPGDVLINIDSVKADEWKSVYRGQKAGDTCLYRILRNGEETVIPIILTSYTSFNFGFTLSVYIILVLLSVASLYLPYYKPNDQALRLFFIYLGFYVITQNADYFALRNPLAQTATFVFLLSSCLIGPLLIHFHLLFPRPAKIYPWFRNKITWFYVAGVFVTIAWFVVYLLYANYGLLLSTMRMVTRICLLWMISTYFLAVGIVFLQFFSIKETFSRNQLRLVLIGSFFGIYTAIPIVFFDDFVQQVSAKYPYLIYNLQGIGSLIMIGCILIAIFRYRIWDIEIFFRKTLLYLAATAVIIILYLFLIFLLNKLTLRETDLIRFMVLAISVIIFLALRDWLQKSVDRFFQRESYDSASVVSDFEEQLAGTYHPDLLKAGIVEGLDKIFHFRTFLFGLKKSELRYEPAYILGEAPGENKNVFEISPEFERMLTKSKVFSPHELDQGILIPEITAGELIVPLVEENQPYGFFVCGPKKSEKTYSIQDIRVLSLIAKRIIALFHTATLYQKDLDRQIMLERERARISQDMHDDVGASLTRISILSDLVKNKAEIKGETRQWITQISDTSRKVTEEMSQIIWALNPKNDTLEGLIAYLRRFAFEYLEPTSVNCSFSLPETLPEYALSVEVRRNVYLVVRETLHNVVKHSGATQVWISLELKDKGLLITIKDNGAGFDPENPAHRGNGLINMKKRMNDIGGQFVLRSVPGDGTEVKLIVQCADCSMC